MKRVLIFLIFISCFLFSISTKSVLAAGTWGCVWNGAGNPPCQLSSNCSTGFAPPDNASSSCEGQNTQQGCGLISGGSCVQQTAPPPTNLAPNTFACKYTPGSGCGVNTATAKCDSTHTTNDASCPSNLPQAQCESQTAQQCVNKPTSTRYSCASGSCQPDPNGSLSIGCENKCSPPTPIKKYSCNGRSGCQEDPNGSLTYAACTDTCHPDVNPSCRPGTAMDINDPTMCCTDWLPGNPLCLTSDRCYAAVCKPGTPRVPKDHCSNVGTDRYEYDKSTKSCQFVGKTAIFLCLTGECPTALGNIDTDPAGIVGFFLKLALALAGLSIIFVLITVGYRVLTSGGNPEKLQSAKELITSLLGGVLLIIFSMVILRAVGVDILGLPGFQ